MPPPLLPAAAKPRTYSLVARTASSSVVARLGALPVQSATDGYSITINNRRYTFDFASATDESGTGPLRALIRPDAKDDSSETRPVHGNLVVASSMKICNDGTLQHGPIVVAEELASVEVEFMGATYRYTAATPTSRLHYEGASRATQPSPPAAFAFSSGDVAIGFSTPAALEALSRTGATLSRRPAKRPAADEPGRPKRVPRTTAPAAPASQHTAGDLGRADKPPARPVAAKAAESGGATRPIVLE